MASPTKRSTKRTTATKKVAKKTPTRTPDTGRCSMLQTAIANRARLVLSLCDQRAKVTLSHPVVAAGMSEFLERMDYQEHSMVSRLLRARRNWKPDHIQALACFAAEYGVLVDPGWIAFGDDSKAPFPTVPLDCKLRESTELKPLTQSPLNLRDLPRVRVPKCEPKTNARNSK